MLEDMRIRGLGVIEDATLEFGPGLTVLTGETGAGKTMVVSGLALLLGGRADVGLVRSGADRAAVEGRLRLAAGSAALERALDAGAEADEDGSLIVARTVASEGRSRAHLGGRSVPVGVLGELADHVLALHGQSDQLALLRPGEQRAALDRYAGEPVEKVLGRYRTAFRRWQQLAADLDDRTRRTRERRQQAEMLRHGLAEIAAVDPQPGEDVELAVTAARLANVDALRVAAETAHESLASDAAGDAVDASGLVGAARRALEQVEDPELAELAGRCSEIAGALADVSAELGAYLAKLDADPAALAAIEERRSALKALTRTYAEDVDGVLAWAKRARDRLAELDTSDGALAALRSDVDDARAGAAALAVELSGLRTAAAERFARAVSAELPGLAMPDAAVHVVVSHRADDGGPTLQAGNDTVGAGPDGIDEVALLLVSHRGAPPRPLARAASGGELSRVMLAVEVVFAGADPVPTMVFDEVDAGVGGQAAAQVGQRLARLARDHQVIVVTHLPQVAAYADRHLVVSKDRSGRVTRSGVRTLAEGERARELARMLAGLADSELGRAHAEELLETARADKAGADEGGTGKAVADKTRPAKRPVKGSAKGSPRRRRTAS